MPMAVFDIDGTLTRTTGIDDHCFLDAVQAVFGLTGIDDDWANYPHATDTGLLDHVPRRYLGRGPTAEEAARFQAYFLDLLRTQAAPAGRVQEVAGAGAVIAALRARGWIVALATGAWRESARIKLGAAGLDLEHLPAAFADDAAPRADISAFAIARGLGTTFDPRREPAAAFVSRVRAQAGGIVYVGDGVWDLRTSHDLGLGFVGVRVNDDPARLLAEGADPRHIVRDFTPAQRLVDLLAATAR